MTSVSKPNVENSHFLSKLARCRSPLAIMCHIWTLFCPICAEISFGSEERPHTALGISGGRFHGGEEKRLVWREREREYGQNKIQGGLAGK